MLEVVHRPNYKMCLSNSRMPVDFTGYLMSSSPPEISFLSEPYMDRTCRQTYGFSFQSDSITKRSLAQRRGPLKSIMISKCDGNGNNCNNSSGGDSDDSRSDGYKSDECLSDTPQSPTSPGGQRGVKKKVSFADHRGRALTTVRIMTEPSDMPPVLPSNILSALTDGASAGVTETPPLLLNFTQPASDYLDFRDKLEHNFVSLENVILKDYNIMGTIKVKNISFEKHVFIRITYDSWESFDDITASFVANPSDSCAQASVYDTFTFDISIPTNFDMDKNMEFSVCYEVTSCQYWDSNNGSNYSVIAEKVEHDQDKYKGVTSVSDVRKVDSWTEFACWNRVDTTLPYW